MLNREINSLKFIGASRDKRRKFSEAPDFPKRFIDLTGRCNKRRIYSPTGELVTKIRSKHTNAKKNVTKTKETSPGFDFLQKHAQMFF